MGKSAARSRPAADKQVGARSHQYLEKCGIEIIGLMALPAGIIFQDDRRSWPVNYPHDFQVPGRHVGQCEQ
jgi:hypothetical protein